MTTITRVVDNRVFLLGLDFAYREAIKPHERGELLRCARAIAGALQDVDEKNAGAIVSRSELQRLREVTSSPIFGDRPKNSGKLLPGGYDALSHALQETFPEWTVANLMAAAHRAAIESDEISLVGLAARANDPVVLAATRESVVLYALAIIGAALHPPQYEYDWKVDPELAQQANRFIDTFNTLFGEKLPRAEGEQAASYWHLSNANTIYGRCVRLGSDNGSHPVRYYHWGIRRTAILEYEVQEFWKPEVWTTERYRSALQKREF